MKKYIIRIALIVLLFVVTFSATFLILEIANNNSRPVNATVINTAETTEATVESTSETTVTTTETTETQTETSVFDPQSTSPTKVIETARAPYEYDENKVYISMENILQTPELPVGCEITALTIYLKYLDFDAEKTEMAKNYLPISPWGNSKTIDGEMYKDSFFDYFIGDPFSKGYGCFSNAIEKAANDYIADNGGGYTVKNISGSEPYVLYDYLANGIPVLCWATDGMIEPEYYESWYDNETGEKLDWYLNEHCFVLAGFDMDNNLVTLNDPMKGIIDYNKSRFEKRYVQMYSQAIVILNDEETNAENNVSSETEINNENME